MEEKDMVRNTSWVDNLLDDVDYYKPQEALSIMDGTRIFARDITAASAFVVNDALQKIYAQHIMTLYTGDKEACVLVFVSCTSKRTVYYRVRFVTRVFGADMCEYSLEYEQNLLPEYMQIMNPCAACCLLNLKEGEKYVWCDMCGEGKVS